MYIYYTYIAYITYKIYYILDIYFSSFLHIIPLFQIGLSQNKIS